jgi:hypothetical protein
MERSHEDDTRPVLSLDAVFTMQQSPRTKSVCLMIQQRTGQRFDSDAQTQNAGCWPGELQGVGGARYSTGDCEGSR